MAGKVQMSEGDRLDPRDEPVAMARAKALGFVCSRKLVSRVDAHGFEQPETRFPFAIFYRRHERLCAKRTQQIKDLNQIYVVAYADRLGSFEREASRVHRKAPKQCTLVRFKEVVTPIERRREGLLTLNAPPTAGQEPEPILEARGDLLWRQQGDARCGELDREWNPV